MALLDDMRLAVRVTSTAMDTEIQSWIDSAIADMKRVGVDETMLDPESPSAAVRSAITCWVKGNFGYDNDEAARFLDSYRSIVIGLLNSSANVAAEEAEVVTSDGESTSE